MILDELGLGQGGLGPTPRLLLLLFLSHFLLPLLTLSLLLLLHSAPTLSAALFPPAFAAPFTTATRRRQGGSGGRRRGRNPIPVPGGGKRQILLVLRQLTFRLEQLKTAAAAGNRADAIATAILLVVVIGQLQLDVGLVFVGRRAVVVILACTGGRG
jgi:hypothetical protein